MYKILSLIIGFSLALTTKGVSQCLVEVNSNGFEYNVDIDLSVTDVIYTQSGSTCNVQIEVTYDITLDVINQPGWWTESLYVLQGNLNCANASGTSFFDLPNSGGTGSVLSATFSFSNENCDNVNLDCPIEIQIQGPELNQTISCGNYVEESILPITLASFSYDEIDKNLITLNWGTYSEINFSHFEVESSLDYKNWMKISSVEGANAINGSSYQYTIPSQNVDQYVRLKMIDIDGRYEYSKALVLPFSERASISLFPNPTRDRLYLTGLSIDQVAITNSIGQKQYITVDSNQSIDVNSLRPGYYILTYKHSNGTNQILPFIKQ